MQNKMMCVCACVCFFKRRQKLLFVKHAWPTVTILHAYLNKISLLNIQCTALYHLVSLLLLLYSNENNSLIFLTSISFHSCRILKYLPKLELQKSKMRNSFNQQEIETSTQKPKTTIRKTIFMAYNQ